MAIHAPITGARRRAPISDDTRQAIEAQIEKLIGLLDLADGDPDLEPNGDELDGCDGSEDEFMRHGADGGPGCPISDPGEDEHDREAIEEREEVPSAMEWDEPSRAPAGARKSLEAHRTYLRRARCFERRRPRWGGGTYRDGWRLIDAPTVPRFPQLRRRRAQAGGARHGRR